MAQQWTCGILILMSDVTHILSRIESGDPSAAEQLLPLVYDELRKLAAARLAQEKPGQTLQATALVHDVYIRLVGVTMLDNGIRGAISLPQPPKRCDEYWWRLLVEKDVRSTGVNLNARSSSSVRSSCQSPLTN